MHDGLTNRDHQIASHNQRSLLIEIVNRRIPMCQPVHFGLFLVPPLVVLERDERAASGSNRLPFLKRNHAVIEPRFLLPAEPCDADIWAWTKLLKFVPVMRDALRIGLEIRDAWERIARVAEVVWQAPDGNL